VFSGVKKEGATKSRFVPGHDHRLFCQLRRALADWQLSRTQKKLVAKLGWERRFQQGGTP
jgi:hypothetical protein